MEARGEGQIDIFTSDTKITRMNSDERKYIVQTSIIGSKIREKDTNKRGKEMCVRGDQIIDVTVT